MGDVNYEFCTDVLEQDLEEDYLTDSGEYSREAANKCKSSTQEEAKKEIPIHFLPFCAVWLLIIETELLVTRPK